MKAQKVKLASIKNKFNSYGPEDKDSCVDIPRLDDVSATTSTGPKR